MIDPVWCAEDVGMRDREALTEVRALVARRDDADLVGWLWSQPWPRDCLQLVGEGLRAAIADRVEGSAEVGREVVARLRERGWDGDGS